MSDRLYPAKLLLFGEYTVLNGSQALAIPLTKWYGLWEENSSPIQTQSAFAEYISWMADKGIIDADTGSHMIEDHQKGITFTSNIPIGYGLGSSGAYVAALYDRYLSGSDLPVSELQKKLAEMESYFHGSSSGMDPMVSYTRSALYKNEKGEFRSVPDPGWPEGFQVSFLDTGISRSTQPLVDQYRQMMQNEKFDLFIRRHLIPVVEHGIHSYLLSSASLLEDCLAQISAFQRQYFSDFIPDTVKEQWDDLRKESGVYVKLCGAGGGGYFIVITTPNFQGSLPTHLVHVNLKNE